MGKRKKARKRLRKRIIRYLEAWTEPLGLSHWHNDVSFYRTTDDYRATTNASENGVMICDCAWQYQQIHLSVNLEKCAGLDNARLEYAVVHELCHALVNEMREIDENGRHEERVVTALAKAFRWVRNASIRGELTFDA